MFLKSLSLVGFKSFADRTRLEFEPGVNVVVGPNGSGKSNLVDGVAWVMGTQATAQLRLHKMDEVIFNGSAVRKRHGRAEVSLTLDNGSGALPLDIPEVTLTRRLHRDGTSEYEINGTPCRLQDVADLLSDSSVGRHQHVIVGQGRIAEILSARPEDQRAVIEEAAGVVKYRNRRDRSLRRLEATASDLQRLQDILAEQRRRMRPLRRQARAAERFDALRDEWRALRLWIGGEELRNIDGRRADVDRGLDETASRLDAITRETEELEAAISKLDGEAGVAGAALQRDTSAAARLETSIERLQRIAAVARERRLAHERHAEAEEARLATDAAEKASLEKQLSAAAEELDAARAALAELSETVNALEDEERALADQLQLPADGLASNLRGDLMALEAAAARDERERTETERRRAVIAEMVENHAAEGGRLNDEVRSTDAATAPLAVTFDKAEAAHAAAQDHLAASRLEWEECRSRLAIANARVESLEPDPEKVHALGAEPAVGGTLLDHIGIPDHLQAAVAAALGPWSEARVVTTGAARDVAERLEAAGVGDVALVGDWGGRGVPARVAESEGGQALVDLLEGEAVVLDVALGDVALFAGRPAAWDFVTAHPELRAVTLAGDLVAGPGIRLASSGGSPQASARREQETAAVELRRAESRQRAARTAVDETGRAAASARSRLEDAEARLGGLAEALAAAERRRHEAAAELTRLDNRLTAIAAATTPRAERMHEVRQRLASLDGPQPGAAVWDALHARRGAVELQRRERTAARDEAHSNVAALEERTRLHRDRIAGLAEAPVPAPAASTGSRLDQVEDLARGAVSVLRAHLATLRDRQRVSRAASGRHGSDLSDAHQQRTSLESEIFGLREQRAAFEVEMAELRVRREGVAEGLRRDVDAAVEVALGVSRPECEGDPGARLDELEKQLHRMGPVNPLAADEYREMSAHAEFLEGQLGDLEDSRRELRRVISSLEESIAAEFLAAFTDIADCFAENFTMLFPGGRGELRLTDADSPLTTGVDIRAQPLGKRISRLSLLSGGERALAALAYLFAVFRARPSPFYLLDEVEAALDDANLRRFLSLVETMRGSSQLVIVTHQQHTMEAADTLYGVTMQPGESSVVVSKKLVTT